LKGTSRRGGAGVTAESTSGIITAVTVTVPGEPDRAQVQPLVAQTGQLSEQPVEQVIGDTAYSTRTAIAQAGEVEVELVARMPSPPEGRHGPATTAFFMATGSR